MITKEPKLNGLVLAGGKSIRMGHDKSVINWQGKEQRYFIADLLKQFCDEVYISCRDEKQANDIDDQYKTIADCVDGKGPIVGILSALEKDKEAAWLVIACDLPLMDETTIQHLIDNRDADKLATTYKSPHDGLPEPLISIWEPRSIEAIYASREDGNNCPRKVLINSDAHIIEPQNPDALINVNTPQDAEQVKNIIAEKLKQAS